MLAYKGIFATMFVHFFFYPEISQSSTEIRWIMVSNAWLVAAFKVKLQN